MSYVTVCYEIESLNGRFMHICLECFEISLETVFSSCVAAMASDHWRLIKTDSEKTDKEILYIFEWVAD